MTLWTPRRNLPAIRDAELAKIAAIRIALAAYENQVRFDEPDGACPEMHQLLLAFHTLTEIDEVYHRAMEIEPLSPEDRAEARRDWIADQRVDLMREEM